MDDTIRLLGDLMASGGFLTVAGVVFLVVILFRGEKIGEAVERLLCRFFPSYDARKAATQRARENDIKERVDTALVMQSVITDARTRMDSMEARLDKRDAELYEIIRRHERLESGVIEALRDISEQMRARTNLLNRTAPK